jgi:DNA-binding transcriptional LysR family regulator
VDLDLTCVETFIVLTEELHFAQAARVLHLTPSALSKRVQRLERQLGVRLVNRGTEGFVSLTAAGTRFTPHARALLQSADDARSAARRPRALLEFRLGMPGQVTDHPERIYLFAVAQALRREVPGAKLRCYGIPFPFVVSALLDKTVDVMWDVSSANHPEIETVPLRSFDRIGVVPIEHPFADAEEVSVQEFAQQPMIYGVGVPSAWMGRFYLDDVRPVSDAQLVAMTGRNSTDVRGVLAMRSGVTVAPAFMVSDVGPGLTTVRLAGVPPTPSFASRRIHDDRESVLRLIHVLQGLNTAV